MHAKATFETDRPERWAKQLVSHLGHKATINSDDNGSFIKFGSSGTGRVETTATTLVMTVSADTAEELERLKHILESHLLRFAGLEGDFSLEWR